MDHAEPGPQHPRAFDEHLLGLLTGGVLTMLISVGHRTGLFEAAAREPATSDELAVADAADLTPDRPYDVIAAFDAIHDQAAPEAVLRNVYGALAPGGVFVMVDTKFATRLEDNTGNPYAPLSYGISLLFCVPTSVAPGGAGLGAMWGQELARDMLGDAGFTDVQVLDSPRPQNCIYVCRARR